MRGCWRRTPLCRPACAPRRRAAGCWSPSRGSPGCWRSRPRTPRREERLRRAASRHRAIPVRRSCRPLPARAHRRGRRARSRHGRWPRGPRGRSRAPDARLPSPGSAPKRRLQRGRSGPRALLGRCPRRRSGRDRRCPRDRGKWRRQTARWGWSTALRMPRQPPARAGPRARSQGPESRASARCRLRSAGARAAPLPLPWRGRRARRGGFPRTRSARPCRPAPTTRDSSALALWTSSWSHSSSRLRPMVSTRSASAMSATSCAPGW